jgi:hypothetical protein
VVGDGTLGGVPNIFSILGRPEPDLEARLDANLPANLNIGDATILFPF